MNFLTDLPPDHPMLAADPGESAEYHDQVRLDELEEEEERIAWEREAGGPDRHWFHDSFGIRVA